MPKEAIDVKDLIARLIANDIKMDEPLTYYVDVSGNEFPVFQNSGLNILLGLEGNGKTKFLTHLMIDVLNASYFGTSKKESRKILYVDTERPESQYAFTIAHILDKCNKTLDEFIGQFAFLAAIDLSPLEIRISISEHLLKNRESKFVIVIDHLLPLVIDMNSPTEANQLDLILKQYISLGHIVIASIHMAAGRANGQRGIGHIGSATQKLASNIVEISNADGGGFKIKQVKSRIFAPSKAELILGVDGQGNIDPSICPVITGPMQKVKKNKEKDARDILVEFFLKSLQSKKELIDIIKIKYKWKPKSSSANTYYNEHLSNLIQFNSDRFTITEAGKSLLGAEYELFFC